METLLIISAILVALVIYSVSIGGAATTHDDLRRFTDDFLRKEILRVGAWFKRHNDAPQYYLEKVAKSGVTAKYHDYYARLGDEESRRSLARKILDSIPEFKMLGNFAYETFINDGMMKIAWNLRKDEKWSDGEIIDWVRSELESEGDPGATQGGSPQITQGKPSNQCGGKTEKESTITISTHRGENELGNGILRINYGNDDHVVTWEDLGEKSARMAVTATRIYYDEFKVKIPNVAEIFSHNFSLFLLNTLPFLITADVASLIGGKNVVVTEEMLQSYCNGAVKVVMDMTDSNNSPIWSTGFGEYVGSKIKFNCKWVLGNPGKPVENGMLMMLIKEWVQLLWIEFGLPSFDSEEELKQVVFIFFSVSSKVFDPSAAATVVQTQ